MNGEMTGRPTRVHQRTWLVVGAVALLMAMPLLITPIPLLIDLPSHIARFHIERDLATNAALQVNFTYAWRYLPNLGIDLIVAPLGRLIGIELAARIAVAMIPAAGAAGMLLVGRALHGRITLGTLLALPLNYAYPLVFGFVNSCLAVSLAFLAFGIWLSLEGRPGTRTAFAIVAAPVVLTAHIIGYGALGLMVAGAALTERAGRRRSNREVLSHTLRSVIPLAWPLPLLLLWQTSSTPPGGRWFDWHQTAIWLTSVLRDRYAWVDIASVGLLYGALLLPVFRRGQFAVLPKAAVPAALIGLAVVALPGRIFGSEFASVRLIPVALALALMALRELTAPSGRMLMGAAVFVAARLALNTVSLVTASQQAERELAVLPAIAPGARVAAVQVTDCVRHWAPPRLSHIMSYATIRRDAFTNGQFAAVPGQALGLTSRIDPGLENLLTTGTMAYCARFRPPTPLNDTLAALPWGRIDYLWLLNVADAPVKVPSTARPIWKGGAGSRLYVIGRPR